MAADGTVWESLPRPHSFGRRRLQGVRRSLLQDDGRDDEQGQDEDQRFGPMMDSTARLLDVKARRRADIHSRQRTLAF